MPCSSAASHDGAGFQARGSATAYSTACVSPIQPTSAVRFTSVCTKT
uniref:Uncharacterized protein n=1 Tax=Arundo donax TaxID=35708 RepID=A0A0A8YSN9_ARUDO